jgi:putative heme-binding domain-containing protein
VTLKLNEEESVEGMLAVDRRPMRGDFGLTDARIIAPGAPERSVMLYRMATSGGGHMPPLGTREVDVAGLDALEAWIRALGDTAIDPEVAAEVPDDTSGALRLARAFDRGEIGEAERARLLPALTSEPKAEVRALFERFRPASERVETLGGSFDPAAVLRLAGDVDRGRALFREDASIQCRSCHVLEGVGRELGPDLAKSAAKHDRAALLEHVVRPSRTIDEPYRAMVIETADGRLLVGLVVERTHEAITLRDANGETTRIGIADIEQMAPSATSLMPEGLLSGLTAQQAADLIAYLHTTTSASAPAAR